MSNANIIRMNFFKPCVDGCRYGGGGGCREQLFRCGFSPSTLFWGGSLSASWGCTVYVIFGWVSSLPPILLEECMDYRYMPQLPSGLFFQRGFQNQTQVNRFVQHGLSLTALLPWPITLPCFDLIPFSIPQSIQGKVQIAFPWSGPALSLIVTWSDLPLHLS